MDTKNDDSTVSALLTGELSVAKYCVATDYRHGSTVPMHGLLTSN
jgi:hypothetical protein